MEAKVNIKYDELASGVSRLAKEGNQRDGANEVLQPPYKGSKAMLKVNGTLIISNLREHLLQASHKPTLEKYHKKRFDWQHGTFDKVYWKSIK